MAGIGDILGGVGSSVATFGVIMIVCLLVAGVVGFAIFAYTKYKKYKQYKMVIWERDAFGNVKQYFDDAGVFVDKKTNNKRLFLRRANVGLEADNIPYIDAPKGVRLVYVVRRGLKNFQYIKPTIGADDFDFQVTEEDVNWAVNAYERQKKMFANNLLLQYMPFILLAFISIIILIMFIYFFKDFGVLREVAVAFKDAATAFAQSQGGVIPA